MRLSQTTGSPAPACYAAEVTLRENEPLAPHTTLGLGGPARYWAEIEAEADIPAALAWALERGLALLPIGAGSNLLVADSGFPGLVLHLNLRGTRWLEGGRVRAAAGEDWDALVAAVVERGWAGIGCLSGIPGSVGAAPVQNIGAYGQEVADTITCVRAWDRQTQAWVELTPAECGFAYRRSRFQAAQRFLITAVEFQLRPGGAPTLRYPELQHRLPAFPSLAAVRAAVRELRRGKAMLLDPAEPDSRSAGSFFKNPVLLPAAAAALPPEAPRFPDPSGGLKVPAAWLIEHSGFTKGFRLPASGVRLSHHHVLALVNDGHGTAAEAMALARHIQHAVAQRWTVALDIEPVCLGFPNS